jgi:hypothetical protein
MEAMSMNFSFSACGAETVLDTVPALCMTRTPIFAESVAIAITHPHAVPKKTWERLFRFFFGCYILAMFVFVAVNLCQVVGFISR